MLISITNKCRMNCPHCMDNAIPDGNLFMDKKTFIDALEFNFRYDRSLLITGGEPTEHPDFWEYLDIIEYMVPKNGIAVTITTNGMNLNGPEVIDRIKILTDKFNSKNDMFGFQVTSVPLIYPIQIDKNNPVFNLDNVLLITELKHMYPQGRILSMDNITYNTIGPKCFNFRSIIRSTNNLNSTVKMLRSLFKYCTPRISYNGDIKLGESSLCPTVASIYDTEDAIVNKAINFKCDGCKIAKSKLTPKQLFAIGE